MLNHGWSLHYDLLVEKDSVNSWNYDMVASTDIIFICKSCESKHFFPFGEKNETLNSRK